MMDEIAAYGIIICLLLWMVIAITIIILELLS